MNAYMDVAPHGVGCDGVRRRKLSRLAALAASASLAAIASPAYAQCVEGPPANFTCSGQTDISQTITTDDAKVTADLAFEVDTSSNGNGFALDVSGDGLISYEGGEAFTGAGVRFATTGSSGLSDGALSIFSNADIAANGTRGLILENNGGGDTVTSWLGTIANISGDGVYASSAFGAGDLSLIVKDVSARDDGIRIAYDANGSATVTAVGPIVGDTGAGVRIFAGDAADDVDLTVGEVTGGTFGIIVDSTGTDIVKVDASGTVTGLSNVGIRVTTDADTTGIEIRAAQVNGALSGILASNDGSGNTTVIATGLVTSANEVGIVAFNGVLASDVSVTAVDVIGELGINAYNAGTGSTTVVATGDVIGFGNDGVRAATEDSTTSVLIDVRNVEGAEEGIDLLHRGTGTAIVRASGAVTGGAGDGIHAIADAAGLTIEVADVSGATGISARNMGLGSTHVSATGTVTGTAANGFGISAIGHVNSGDLLVSAVDVSGGARGINVDNLGTETLIATTGFVTGGETGIFARNGLTSTNLVLRANAVAGGEDGIVVENDGTGTTSIIATTVTGQTGIGVNAQIGAGAGAVDVTVGDVTGGEFGIVVGNGGTGSTRVEATGTITGVNDRGIVVTNSAAATDIEIHANNVNGGYFAGIQALNDGTGNTTIGSTGLVATNSLYGIVAVNEASANNLSISAVDVIGAFGISASNFGTGATEIISTGSVIGFSGDGVRVGNTPTSTDLRVDVNVVEGSDRGMRVVNNGTGSTSIRASGAVTGATLNGIEAEIGIGAQGVTIDAVDVTGGINGVDLVNFGQGTTLVHATGALIGQADSGLHIVTGTGAQDVSVEVAQTTGSIAGISIEHNGTGSVGVSATGTASAAAPDGIGIVVLAANGASDVRIGTASVSGGYAGIHATNQGSGLTAIDAGGPVSGGAYGILARNEASATHLSVHAVTVTGTGDGIAVENLGSGMTIVSAASATGAGGTGVRVDASGAAGAVDVALGDASGGDYGVLVTNFGTGTTTVETTGVVTGIGDGGIAIENGGASTGIELHAAQVSGETYGIAVQNSGTGNTAVFATGPVTGAGGGMIVRNDATASNLLVDAAAVQGGSTGILAVNQGSGTTSIRASGTVTGGGLAGIDVRADVSALDVAVDTAEVGGGNGIIVQNFGQGSASVNASGSVTGTNATGTGIAVVGGTGSNDIRVAAVGVAGGARGISTVNDGSGETLIATTGLVSGGEFGIRAANGLGATDLTIRAADVQTAGSGIFAENLGSGRTNVLVGGTITAQGDTGIGVSTGAASNDIIVEAASISGAFGGIYVGNGGNGATSILTSGSVSGNGFGILAVNGAGSTDLTIRTASVQGGSDGIVADNAGSGETNVVATANVTGGNNGIVALAGANAGGITVLATSVSGGVNGLRTENNGVSATAIRTTGSVTGGDDGILAQNGQSATDLTVRVTDVQAVGNGITTENLGTGETRVIATGTVVAQDEVGILVFAGGNSGDVTVEANNATGGLSGISAINYGLGDTRVTVSGVAQGGTNGVEAFSDGNQGVVIVNNGTIRNASGLGSAKAISASGGGVGIGNTGTLLGTVAIAGDTSLLINSGSWRSTGGTSNFATLDDTLLNATTGTIVGGVLAGTTESTMWQGLERLRNDGVLRLQDGGVGDVIQTSAATIFSNGSLLSVDIAGVNGADSFRTADKVTIEAGSKLQAATTQPLVLHGKYVVVQADGGLTGQFQFEDQLITAFAGLRDGYTATSAFLEFAQMKALDSAGITPNQKAAAAGADSLPDGNAVKDALLLLPTDAAAQAAFDQLSGEIHPSARNAMVEDSRLVRNAVLDRLANEEQGWSLWGRLFSTSGASDGDYNAAALDRDTKGGVIGLDRNVGPVTIGVAGGWTDTNLRVARRDSNGSIEGIHGLVYVGARFGGFGLRGGIGYARTSTETTRRIAFAGLSATPAADYDGSVLQGFVEAGYRLPVAGGYVEPFAGLTAIRAKTDAFTETGGPAALSGAAIREDVMRSTLGARFQTSPAGRFSLRGTAGWQHGWGDLDPVGRHSFAGGTPFTVLGTAASKDAGLLNAEARFQLSQRVTFSLGYDGVLGSGTADHAITGGLRIVF